MRQLAFSVAGLNQLQAVKDSPGGVAARQRLPLPAILTEAEAGERRHRQELAQKPATVRRCPANPDKGRGYGLHKERAAWQR